MDSRRGDAPSVRTAPYRRDRPIADRRSPAGRRPVDIRESHMTDNDLNRTDDNRPLDENVDPGAGHDEHGNEARGAGAGARAGAGVGMAVGGPPGAVIGGAIGAVGGAVAGEASEGNDEAGAGAGGLAGGLAGAAVGGAIAGPPGAVVGGAVGAALISGLAIYLNGFAVKQLPDAAVYTTLKNAVAAVILIAAAGLDPDP